MDKSDFFEKKKIEHADRYDYSKHINNNYYYL